MLSKVTATKYIQHYCEEYGIEGVVLRSSLIRGLRFLGYSTKLHEKNWIFKTQREKFIDKAIKGEDIEIWGECSKTAKKRDIIYVKDVVDFISTVLDTPNIYGCYSIASGNILTLEDEIKEIIKVFSDSKNPSKIIYRPEFKGQEWDIIFDVTKTRKDIKWTPKYSYEAMLLDIKDNMKKDGYFDKL